MKQEAGLLWEHSSALGGAARQAFGALPALGAVTPLAADIALAHAGNLAALGCVRGACDAFAAVVPLLSPRASRAGGLSAGRLVAAQCLVGRASAASVCPWLASVLPLPAVPTAMPDVMHAMAMCSTHDTQDARLVRDPGWSAVSTLLVWRCL